MEIYRKVLQFSTNRNLLLKRHPLFDFLTSDVLFTIFSLTLKTGKRKCPILSGINISALRSPDAPHDEHHPGPTTLQPGVQQPSVPRSVTSLPPLSHCVTLVFRRSDGRIRQLPGRDVSRPDQDWLQQHHLLQPEQTIQQWGHARYQARDNIIILTLRQHRYWDLVPQIVLHVSSLDTDYVSLGHKS